MSLLLVNPNRELRPVPAMPLGLLRVAEAARAEGVDVTVLDLAFTRDPERALLRALDATKPALVGFTVRNLDNADARAPRFYLDDVRPLVAAARRAHSAPMVIGGPGVPIAAEAVRRDLGADCAVLGPGEGVIASLLQDARAGRELPPQVEAPPVVTAPGADFAHWLDLRPWRRRAAPLPIQSRRGCPRACVYCNYAAIEGSERYLLSDVDEVVRAVAEQVGRTGIRHVEFVDATFNSPPAYAVALCEALARADLGLSLGASGITPRHGTPDVLRAMAAAGFQAIWCSPDTAAPETLVSYGKGFDVEHLRTMVAASVDVGFTVMWSFLFGGPGETEQTVDETLRFVRDELPRHHPVLFTSRMRIYPGTRLAARAQEEGWPEPTLDPRAPGQFYLSPAVDPGWLDERLVATREALPNVMLLDAAQGPIVGVLQQLNGLLGRRSPTWVDYAPIRGRVMRLLGRA